MTTPTSETPKSSGQEVRALDAKIEVRAATNGAGTPMATGYAMLFNNDTDIGGYWTERFAPGAFTNSLAKIDVVSLHGHMRDRPLGRASRDTLRLTEDSKGLKFENDLPDTSDGRDLAVQLERGDIEGMSIGFVTRKQEWDETIDPPQRTIIEADLHEITYTAFPAYPDTSVGLRSLEHVRQEKRDHNQAGARSRIAARKARQAHIERNI